MKRIAFATILAAAVWLPAFAQSNPPDAKSEVGAREQKQQKRIANGAKSGQLTPKETAHVERDEAKINKQVKQERAANGGHLTKGEKAQVNKEQNKVSNKIYDKKHNDRTQP